MILVTGASGYLGSALWSALERQGLVCISAGRTGADRFFDLNDACPSEDLLAGVSTVVHCAGLAHNRGAEAEYQRLNVEGALGLAKAAIRAKVVRFIHISSLNVVPASAEGPNLPAAALPAPSESYARSKWLAERELTALFSETGSELIIVRPALIYDRQLHGNLAKLHNSLPIRLPDTGKRSMVSRPDLIEVLTQLLHRPQAVASTVDHCAVADGQAYSAHRISEALVPGRALELPRFFWSGLFSLLGLLPLQLTRALLQSLTEEHWTSPDGNAVPQAVRWRLEDLQDEVNQGGQTP